MENSDIPMPSFQGILPALLTPLTPDLDLDTASAERLIGRLYEHPIDGLYVAGQTGEGTQLSVGQRKRLAEIAVRNSPPGKDVIVHIGAVRAADAVELARHAAASGVHALSSLPPAGGWSFPEVYEWYRIVTSAADLPFFVYFFPSVNPALQTVEQMLSLCSLPNVVGLKYTDYDLYRMVALKQSGAKVYYGRDEVLAAGLLMGADGGIGSFYNLVPDWFTEIWRLSRKGDWEAARPIQDRILRLIQLCQEFPMLAAIKAIAAWQGVECGPCLAPRQNLTPDQRLRLQQRLLESGFAPALKLELSVVL